MKVLEGVRGPHLYGNMFLTIYDFEARAEELEGNLRQAASAIEQEMGRVVVEEIKEQLRESDLVEVRLIVSSQPDKISAVGSKTPEIMEMGLTGGDVGAQLDWAAEKLGEELGIEDVFESGSDIDVIGVTKGYGNQGVVPVSYTHLTLPTKA